MYTLEKKIQSAAEMRQTARAPFKALRLLYSLKHRHKPTAQFAGFLQYYLHFVRFDITPLLNTNKLQRTLARGDIEVKINQAWQLGFVDDEQRQLLKLANKLIYNLINNYFFIYIWL